MARIQTYTVDTTLNSEDMIIGTDGAQGANYATKNFTVGDLRTFILQGVSGEGGIPYTNDNVDTHLNVSSAESSQVLSWNGSDYTWVTQSSGSSFSDADVDTHLNKTNTTPDNYVLSLSSGDYAWVAQSGGGGFDGQFSSLTGAPTTIAGYGITDALQLGTTSETALPGDTVIPAAYTDSDVDAHLNKTATTQDNYVLSLSGNDYTWVAQSGGGGGIGGSGTDTQMAIFDSESTITSTQAVAVNSSSQIIMDVLRSSNSYADDAAALAGGVPYGGLYRTDSTVKINLLASSPDPGEGESVPDPYTSVVGSSFRALGRQLSSPFIGLFDSNLALVSPQPSFGALPNNSYTVAAASDNYTYILAGGINQTTVTPKISTDSGATWSSLPSPVSGLYSGDDLTMSKSGQVMVLEPGGTNNYIFVSNDYGSSFTQVTLPLPVGFNVYAKKMVSVSSGGQYIIVSNRITSSTASKSGLFVSQDYGATFTYITDSLPSPVLTSGYEQVLVSGDGQYQYLLSPIANQSKYSSDYGVTWVNKNYGSSDFRETSAISSSGQYALFPRNATNGLFTDDFGATTNEVLSIGNQRRASISSSGEFALFVSSTNSTHYISIDYLSSFQGKSNSGFDGVIVDV